MPRGSIIQSLAIGGGLLVLSVGAFALGQALSGSFKPLPAIVPMPVAAKPALHPSAPGVQVPEMAVPGQPTIVPPPTVLAEKSPAVPVATVPAVAPEAKPVPVVAGPVAQETADPAPSAPEITSRERRAKARQEAAAHWRNQPGATAPAPANPPPPGAEVAMPALEEPPPAKSAAVTGEPNAAAPAAAPIKAPEAVAMPAATRNLGFLTELKGVPEAIAAIDARKDEVAGSLDRLVQGVIDDRSDPMAWSNLAAALDRGGQRSAAIAVANRGMNAAKRQQDGGAVTQLTQQIARLELAGSKASAAAVPTSGKGSGAHPGDPAAVQEPDKLAGALDDALRNNAAAEALKILQQMAQGSMARGDFAAAQTAYNQAINLAHLSKLGGARADQYANLGRMFLQKGDRGEAEAYWRAARDQYEQFDMTSKVAEMNALLRQISPAALSSPSRPTQNGKKTSSIIELR